MSSASFPLRIQPHKRYLEDAAGRPFLIQGDAAWSLIAQLTKGEVEQYLQDRRQRGFNTLLVNLLEHRFAEHAPDNAYGEPPFATPGDYSTPNEKYFAYADWVLSRAKELGFLVLLAPSYAGSGGGEDGWYQEMRANGADKLREYGRYLGRRYQGFDNILWLQGGDYNPPDKGLVRAIAEGIGQLDPTALQSAHAGPESAALQYWRGESWLQVNDVYTYDPVFRASLKQYEDPASMPFFLIESAYENEQGATEVRLRMQAYQALLSGAAGQVFGNNPIWHFDGPGLFPAPTSWQDALGSRGAQSMTYLHDLFAPISWWLLEPDRDNTFLLNGMGSDLAGRAVAALASDRSFALVYLPTWRNVTVDLEKLAGPVVDARWYDPASGCFVPAKGKGPQFRERSVTTLAPESAQNDAGFGDWVLELTSRPAIQPGP